MPRSRQRGFQRVLLADAGQAAVAPQRIEMNGVHHHAIHPRWLSPATSHGLLRQRSQGVPVLPRALGRDLQGPLNRGNSRYACTRFLEVNRPCG